MSVTRLACGLCDEGIGVYEPLVWIRPDGEAIPTSFLALRRDPDYGPGVGIVLHAACHAAKYGRERAESAEAAVASAP